MSEEGWEIKISVDSIADVELEKINSAIQNRLHELFPTVSKERLAEKRKRYYLTLNDEDDEVVALMEGSLYWGWAHINTLLIDSFSRSEGIGTQLLAEYENDIKENHPDIIGIMLETSTEKNVEFYTKCGFIVHGSLEDHPPGAILYYLSKRF